ncbi:hypothetical protein Acy02nite_79910 [Actinoplanes cyaneus]|uniref:Uncharacterized protein n=1 Tax=Actinoplanes cyaneus TaxID=52696 RepID=A0A919IQ24_9ACTN|nr:hypothetical protein Acy02nite_79910 [Actinoplanes cyaneus]
MSFPWRAVPRRTKRKREITPARPDSRQLPTIRLSALLVASCPEPAPDNTGHPPEPGRIPANGGPPLTTCLTGALRAAAS